MHRLMLSKLQLYVWIHNMLLCPHLECAPTISLIRLLSSSMLTVAMCLVYVTGIAEFGNV